MKILSMLAAAGFLAATAATPVMAQVTDPTAAGTATAPSGQEGAPAATTPQGRLATTGTARRPAKRYSRFSSSSRNTSIGTSPAPVTK